MLQEDREWVWLTGNHDDHITDVFSGSVASELRIAGIGAFAGGLNVLDEAFHPLFGDGGMALWMLGQAGLFPVATRLLSQD